MRTVTNTGELTAAITKPTYLVELELDGQTLRYSTRGDVQEDAYALASSSQVLASDGTILASAAGQDPAFGDGPLWTGGELDLIRGESDWSQIVVRLRDAGFARAPNLISGDWRGNPIAVTLLLPDSTEKLALFAGALVSAQVGEWIVFGALRQQVPTAYSPRYRVDKPVFNHLPPPGSTLEWEGELYELEAAG